MHLYLLFIMYTLCCNQLIDGDIHVYLEMWAYIITHRHFVVVYTCSMQHVYTMVCLRTVRKRLNYCYRLYNYSKETIVFLL